MADATVRPAVANDPPRLALESATGRPTGYLGLRDALR